MLVSRNWLEDFVSLRDISAKELMEKITVHMAEVEGEIHVNQHFQQVRVVEIMSFRPHPQADRLRLVQFRLSSDEMREVVCGAPNVAIGLKVPYAAEGTKLPNGMILAAKDIRGFVSKGMLCSSEELGLVGTPYDLKHQDGLLELPVDAPIGMTLADYFKIHSDSILEIDNKSLTHRPDLWGHWGIARDVAAILQRPFLNTYGPDWRHDLLNQFNHDTPAPLTVQLDSSDDALIFLTLAVDGVEVGPSPEWLKNRLESAGLQSINSVVDISNYVMLEIGLPLHFYDRTLIAGQSLIVRKAMEGEHLKLLDQSDIKLHELDKVVADASGPLVLAGIMGGHQSGVQSITTQLQIEVAVWPASSIRKTSTRLGLRTQSSMRFEKTLDPFLAETALLRAFELLKKICPKVKTLGGIQGAGSCWKKEYINPVISLDLVWAEKKLGAKITTDLAKDILQRLGFGVQYNSQGPDNRVINVLIPSFRATKDISIPEDLVEELGRVLGYDKLIPQTLTWPVEALPKDHHVIWRRALADFAVQSARCSEIKTYPLIGSRLLKEVHWPEENEKLKLVNALSLDHDRMRPSLVPSLLQATQANSKHYAHGRFFELGRSYLVDQQGNFTEKCHLGWVFFGESNSVFMDCANAFDDLLNFLSLPSEIIPVLSGKQVCPLWSEQWIGIHPNQKMYAFIMGQIAGGVFSVHPLLLRELKIRGYVAMALLDYTHFQERKIKINHRFQSLSEFPVSYFDCTVVADTSVRLIAILTLLKKQKISGLKDVKAVADYKLSDEKRCITLRSTIGLQDATLSSQELEMAQKSIVKALESAGFPLKE